MTEQEAWKALMTGQISLSGYNLLAKEVSGINKPRYVDGNVRKPNTKGYGKIIKPSRIG
ncbi:MAG: hypothetical protein U0M66_05845 [Bacilli bacterium]|nr:hypothetical protein [Bacilli bacterium]